jgi:hypothetical protein
MGMSFNCRPLYATRLSLAAEEDALRGGGNGRPSIALGGTGVPPGDNHLRALPIKPPNKPGEELLMSPTGPLAVEAGAALATVLF